MDIDYLRFSSDQFLKLIESYGLTGTWAWSFADNEHVWSSGLFGLFGLDPLTDRPNYQLFTRLVHPEDRDRVQTSVDIIQGRVRGSQTFRILRPDSTIRVLSARNEIYLAPNGRPLGAAGVVLDVTSQEKLRQARIAEQRHRQELFKRSRILTFSTDLSNVFTFPQEAFELTGLSPAEIADDPFVTIVSEEREHWREISREALQSKIIHSSQPLLHIAGHNRERFEVFTVPIRNEYGDVVDWSSLTRPIGLTTPQVSDSLRKGLEQAIDGRHLRAARALLDWSMTDLARAAGVSLSTIKRMEEDLDSTGQSSRHKAVIALRRVGIRFSLMEGGNIALGKI